MNSVGVAAHACGTDHKPKQHNAKVSSGSTARLCVDVLVTDELEVVALDPASRLGIECPVRRKLSLMLIKLSNGFDQCTDLVGRTEHL